MRVSIPGDDIGIHHGSVGIMYRHRFGAGSAPSFHISLGIYERIYSKGIY